MAKVSTGLTEFPTQSARSDLISVYLCSDVAGEERTPGRTQVGKWAELGSQHVLSKENLLGHKIGADER